MSDALVAAERKMREHGQAEEAITAFHSAFCRLEAGEESTIASAELEPAGDVPALSELPDEIDPTDLDRFATIKLNGGLATSMGLQQPKSLVAAREGRSFLEVIVGQTLALRRRYGVRLPLVLMDSETTREPSLEALAQHHELEVEGLAADFVQSMIPKLAAESLQPVQWDRAPALEWCPPGHGDVYGSLRSSGMLDALLERGFHFAMISNSDNLGATFDPRIAQYMAGEEIPFLMEVVEGTEADRKGGHIARRHADDQLVLRETAQTPPEDEESFRDYRRWRFYNTNSLWLDLRVLARTLEEHEGVLELPLIVNRKTVDPRDSDSPPVVQMETAMGAAIGSFAGAQLLCVPRTRFVPVKTTDDLLVLRSDVYRLSDEMVVEPVPERQGRLPYVELDERFYRMLDAFEERFPDGPPSLREAERLVVHGDVTFQREVVVRGSVELEASRARVIDAGTVLGD
ncbi:MAG: UTP--glucose-1-phosphate uridylyltransferase [Actinomycetota bacterium]|nr:UTP--glucose-1-phosphate uridylyltransferase [Actinomycetota bacterium]